MADQKPYKLFMDGEACERFMGRRSRRVAEAFLDWLHVPKDLTWLDVGCDEWGVYRAIDRSLCDPTISSPMPEVGARMADFRAGDAQKRPFDNDTFDVAAMALVIAFCPIRERRSPKWRAWCVRAGW